MPFLAQSTPIEGRLGPGEKRIMSGVAIGAPERRFISAPSPTTRTLRSRAAAGALAVLALMPLAALSGSLLGRSAQPAAAVAAEAPDAEILDSRVVVRAETAVAAGQD